MKRLSKSRKKASVNNHSSVGIKLTLSKKRLHSVKSYLPTILIISAPVAIIIMLWPINRTETAIMSVDFKSTKVKSADYELGESVITKKGKKGERSVKYSVSTSLFSLLFGLDGRKKELSSNVITDPVEEVITQGTRKYQYMLCSDGSSRFYDDDQFKDPNTGFTSKSKDYCKENGQGKKIKLTNIPPDNVVANSGRKPTVTVRNGCTYTSIPYKTVYRDVSWLNKGETKVSKGSDGTKSSCGWSTDPIDEEILRGTSEPGKKIKPSTNTNDRPDSTAYSQCLSSYRSAMSQIEANISQGIAGQDYLKRQAEATFLRCKRVAGF